jgi:hypothetical protein
MWYHVGSIDEFPTERDLHPAAIRARLFSHRTAQPRKMQANLQERNE